MTAMTPMTPMTPWTTTTPTPTPWPTPTPPTPPADRQRVRVWFGPHVIADYRANAELAERYAAAMRRRFAGLEITIEPITDDSDGTGTPVPDEKWWEMVPR